MQAFIICGYGIPENITQDVNYTTYLHQVLNSIYTTAKGQEALIIPCGGPTKCDPPYEGTEADVIAEYLSKLADREQMNEHTGSWKIVPEDESLSTLENLVFAKRLLNNKAVKHVTVFCEQTRVARVTAFAQEIFDQQTTVTPIDFDISKNRYLDPAVLGRKEAAAIEEGLWTLEEPDRLERHHEFFTRKFAFLRKRQAEGLSHVDAVKEWFENKEVVRKLMPDHPLLNK